MKKESSHHEMKDCGRLAATATQIASVTYGAVQLLSLHGHTALLDARHHSSNSTNGVVSRVERYAARRSGRQSVEAHGGSFGGTHTMGY